jgi:hypothetical protein
MLGRKKVPFSRLTIRLRFSTHAEHSQAIEGISPSEMRHGGQIQETTKKP